MKACGVEWRCSQVSRLPSELVSGVYYGWASVSGGAIHAMAMSIGFNPHFGNTKKTMETHILHDFGRDFYGEVLHIAVLGWIREMAPFNSLG